MQMARCALPRQLVLVLLALDRQQSEPGHCGSARQLGDGRGIVLHDRLEPELHCFRARSAKLSVDRPAPRTMRSKPAMKALFRWWSRETCETSAFHASSRPAPA